VGGKQWSAEKKKGSATKLIKELESNTSALIGKRGTDRFPVKKIIEGGGNNDKGTTSIAKASHKEGGG